MYAGMGVNLLKRARTKDAPVRGKRRREEVCPRTPGRALRAVTGQENGPNRPPFGRAGVLRAGFIRTSRRRPGLGVVFQRFPR
jgi:hypothetical protein